jgi:triosephosphate isomerase
VGLWLQQFAKIYQSSVKYQVVVAPSFTEIDYTSNILSENQCLNDIKVYAQDVSQLNRGAYTGEVGGYQLKELGVSGVIIGHSERRQYCYETDNDVNSKISRAIDNELETVICVSNLTQVSSLGSINHNYYLAYEPIEAIGSGKSEDLEAVDNFILKAKAIGGDKLMPIYGGSVDSESVKKYLVSNSIAGFLVGTASKDPFQFNGILQSVEKYYEISKF